MKNEKGLSPVIATVLLILMVLVLAGIIFMWARGFVSEQIEKFGQPVETICEQVDFDVQLIKKPGGGDLDIVNRGNVDIHDFELQKTVGGNTEVSSLGLRVDIGEAKSITISFGDVDELALMPRVLGTVKGKQLNTPYTCGDYSKTVNL